MAEHAEHAEQAERRESAEPAASAEYRVLCWRGIPAQVRVSAGGRRFSGQLPVRYQEEIDRVAMEEGLFGSDAYLDQWQWQAPQRRPGEAQEVLDAVIAELVGKWDRKLFGAGGGE